MNTRIQNTFSFCHQEGPRGIKGISWFRFNHWSGFTVTFNLTFIPTQVSPIRFITIGDLGPWGWCCFKKMAPVLSHEIHQSVQLRVLIIRSNLLEGYIMC